MQTIWYTTPVKGLRTPALGEAGQTRERVRPALMFAALKT